MSNKECTISEQLKVCGQGGGLQIITKLSKKEEVPRQRVYYFSKKDRFKKVLSKYLKPQQLVEALKTTKRAISFETEGGLFVAVCSWNLPHKKDKSGNLEDSVYAVLRNFYGELFRKLALDTEKNSILFHFFDAKKEEWSGALVGIQMSHYRFKNITKHMSKKVDQKIYFLRTPGPLTQKDISPWLHLAGGVNMARHLVNLPPNQLNPKSYSEAISQLFKNTKNTRVTVWNSERLKKENMHLLLAVGEGAEEKPCFIHIKYRPPGTSSKKPMAFVGKGITFDSGGLDIKPAPGMRLMKKDMGGSAAVVGLCHWVVQCGVKHPCDFYLAVAENAVSKYAFRPSDIIKSRSGKTVEIHNTDAEGRLVLADALDVAASATGSDEPKLIVDVATLTGAVKVGLGSEVAGVFSNNGSLAQKILNASHASGEPMWRMPLYNKYFKKLDSSFADISNAADGFGGAITAALFLESFVNEKSWAHLDIYAWNERANGALSEAGGSGQAVQTLSFLLS